MMKHSPSLLAPYHITVLILHKRPKVLDDIATSNTHFQHLHLPQDIGPSWWAEACTFGLFEHVILVRLTFTADTIDFGE